MAVTFPYRLFISLSFGTNVMKIGEKLLNLCYETGDGCIFFIENEARVVYLVVIYCVYMEFAYNFDFSF